MDIKSIKKEFLQKGQKVLNYELDIAIGKQPELHGGLIDKSAHPKIVNTMLELIKADTEIQKIQVKNTADILDAISRGEMSISDAKEMVVLLSLINGETSISDADANKIIIEIAEGRKNGGSE